MTDSLIDDLAHAMTDPDEPADVPDFLAADYTEPDPVAEPEPCPTCGGTGQHSIPTKPGTTCSDCGGQGVIARPAPWRIDGERTANWALRRLADAMADIAAAEAVAAEQRQRTDAWLERRCAAARRTASFMESRLKDYLRARVAADPRLRTIPLPDGDLKATASTSLLPATTDDALLAWCKEHHPEFVKVDESVKKGELKKALRANPQGGLLPVLAATGEAVPVKVDREDNYTVKPDRPIG